MALHVAEKFLPLWREKREHYGFHGGRGGAKSHSIGEYIAAISSQQKERVVCGRQFQNSIKDSVKELLEAKIQKLGMAAYWRSLDRELVNTSTGSRISFIGMDRNPESAKSLEGATIFWGEEAQTFTKKSVELIIPTIRTKGSRMIWSWNARHATDPVDHLLRGPEPPENSYVVQVSWRDNPYFYQTRMPSEMRRSKRANPKRHAHIWEGAYDLNPDVGVFPDHEVKRYPHEIPEHVRPRFGMDFGFGADPSFMVKVYVLEPEDMGLHPDEKGVIYIAQEAHGHHISNVDLPALMDTVGESRIYPITADSSRPETIDYLQSAGFNIYGAIKGAGSVKNGINFIYGYRLMIDPDCVQMYEEIRNYQWDVDKNDMPLPILAKRQKDHGIDALRYAVEELSTDSGDSQDVLYL